ncbi:MAG: efflux RND transporter periplasmic adaptor subunit [Deltaproteobacteria bacterium]|nr:efflux RND transporter periplasmic adaptor subunit [Deltaproteobacteria bacterium]
MKKAIILIVLAVLVAAAGWQFYVKGKSPSKSPQANPRNSAVAVEVVSVKQGTVRDTSVFSGTLLPSSQFTVAPKISGRLEKILVNIGDRVTQGQLIALLDDDEYVQQVEQAKAELDVAKANIEENISALNLASREYERTQGLRKKKIVSESELDVAEAQYKAKEAKQKVLLAQVAQKEAALKFATVRLGYTRIRASWENGDSYRVIGERYVDQGAMLNANAPIVSIIDIQNLTAVIHVIERDYPRIKKGQAAKITTDAFPGKDFNGKVTRISPVLKESARQARVEISVPNPSELIKPGMFVRVEIEFEKRENATIIPVNALIKQQDAVGVFLAEGKTMKARFIPVELGIKTGDLVEVSSPTLSGLVVVMGQHLLKDGSPLLITGQENMSSPKKKGGVNTGNKQ